MVRDEVIKLATTEWESPIFFAPKKDGSLRFCVGYPMLDDAANRDLYLLFSLNVCNDSLGDACTLSTLHSNLGYLRVKIEKEDREIATFTGQHCSNQIPSDTIWSENIPTRFQTAMDIIVWSLRTKLAPVYFDDIGVFLTTVHKHQSHLQPVLTLPWNASVALKLNIAPSLQILSTTRVTSYNSKSENNG